MAVLAGLLLLAACNSGDSSPPAKTSGSPPVAGTQPASTTRTPASSLPGVNDEPVAFATEDGVTVRGHLYSVAGPRRKVVIFSHMFPADQVSWKAFAREIVAPGVSTLTYDFRGYGETGGSKDPAKSDLDLTAALRFIKSRDYPQVYLVGASMGGTASLKVAAKQEVAGVVTLSAPIDFQGLNARQDVAGVSEPKLFLASRGDGEAASALSFFTQSAPEPRTSQLFDGSAHGTELLEGRTAAETKRLIAEFVNR